MYFSVFIPLCMKIYGKMHRIQMYVVVTLKKNLLQAEARDRMKPQSLSQGGRLLPKQATKLLKRYPNL